MQEQKAQRSGHSVRERLFAGALALAAALTVSFGSSSAQAAPVKASKVVCYKNGGILVCVPIIHRWLVSEATNEGRR